MNQPDMFPSAGVAPLDLAEEIADALHGMRFVGMTEKAFQEAVRKLLPRFVGVLIVKEAPLEDEIGRNVGRIDFLVGRVGIELKIDGSRAEVIRQVAGYARSPLVDAIVVGSTKAALLNAWPETLVGKPIVVAHVRRWP